MYSLATIDSLAQAYAEIADDLRIQYQIGYNPANPAHDGIWRTIKVQIKGRPDTVVRTRKGYYMRSSQ